MPHRAVERVRPRQQRARRRNAVGRLRRRQERGLATGGRRRGRGRPGDREGLHAEVPVDGGAEVAHRLGAVGKDGGEVRTERPERRGRAALSARVDSSADCWTIAVQLDLQAGPVLRLDHTHERRDRGRRGVGLLGHHAALRGERPVRGGVVALRLPRHLGQAPDQQGRQNDHGRQHDERAGAGSTARAAAGPTGRHRRRNLQRVGCDYTARKEESPAFRPPWSACWRSSATGPSGRWPARPPGHGGARPARGSPR